MLGVPGDERDSASATCLSRVPDAAAAHRECLATRGQYARCGRFAAADRAGRRRRVTHLGVTVSPLRDEHAAHGAICLFYRPHEQTSELEEQLRLKEAWRAWASSTAGIAHEFRNGLATIHGYAGCFAADRSRLPHAYVDGIRQETEALGQRGDELPELREARAGWSSRRSTSRRSSDARGRRARGRAARRTGTVDVRDEFGARSKATRCCCVRCSATCSQRGRGLRDAGRGAADR